MRKSQAVSSFFLRATLKMPGNAGKKEGVGGVLGAKGGEAH